MSCNTVVTDKELRDLYGGLEKEALVEICIRYFRQVRCLRQVERLRDCEDSRVKICHVQSDIFAPMRIRDDHDCSSCGQYF